MIKLMLIGSFVTASGLMAHKCTQALDWVPFLGF